MRNIEFLNQFAKLGGLARPKIEKGVVSLLGLIPEESKGRIAFGERSFIKI